MNNSVKNLRMPDPAQAPASSALQIPAPDPNHFGTKVQQTINECADKTFAEITLMANNEGFPAFQRFAAARVLADFAAINRAIRA